MDLLWAMRVFARVADCGSFSRAAESLDLGNATVTTCVRNLERHLEVALLRRDTRRLSLTDEGSVYLERVRAILHAVDSASDELQARIGELKGPLHVEMPISIGHTLIVPALPAFARRYPGIATAVTLTNQPHHLIERAIDVAIRMDDVEDADLVARPIYEASYKICCTAELARLLPAHPRELNPQVCLGVLPKERRHPVPWRLHKGDESVVIRAAGGLHFNSSDALVQAAMQGVGLIHVLDLFVNRRLEAGDLVEVYEEWDTGAKTFYAVTSKAPTTPAKVKAFIDFLLEVLDSERAIRPGVAVPIRRIGQRR